MSKNNNNLNLNNSNKYFDKLNSLSNTNIGLSSGNNIKTGTNNVTIGYKSLVKESNDKNSIVIGSEAIGQGNNIAVIGNTNIESIQSGTDGLCNLGGITKNFKNIYTKNVNISDNLYVGDDIRLISDSSVLSFGTDSDTTLTHTDGTGLTLNSDNKLCFRDNNIHISSDDDGYMNIQADTGVNINIGGTDKLAITGSIATFGTNIVIPDSGTIGSASDTNAISISSDGNIGIGTDSPQTTLDVNGATALGGTLDVAGTTTLNDNVIISATTVSSSINTGALTVAGGAGISKDLYVGEDVHIDGDIVMHNKQISYSSHKSLSDGGGINIYGGYIGISSINGNSMDIQSTKPDVNNVLQLTSGLADGTDMIVRIDNGQFRVTNMDIICYNDTESTSTTTGALQVAGGVGIIENLNVGGDLNVGDDNFIVSASNAVTTVKNKLNVTDGTTDFLSTSTTGIGLESTSGGTNITGEYARLNIINSVSYPDNDNDLIRKQDLTTLAHGFKIKGHVTMSTDKTTLADLIITGLTTTTATTGTLSFTTTTNLGATITQPTGVGGATADVTLAVDDLILIRDIEDSTSMSNTSGLNSNLCNGIYIYSASTAGTGTTSSPYTYSLVRTENMGNGINAYSAAIYVNGGGYEYQIYIQIYETTDSSQSAIIGTNQLIFTKFSNNRPSISGQGIDVTNQTISVNLNPATGSSGDSTNQLYFSSNYLTFNQSKITEVGDLTTLGVTGTTTIAGNIICNNETESTNTTSGALTVAGGVGISKDLYVGEDVHINGNLLLLNSGSNIYVGTTNSSTTGTNNTSVGYNSLASNLGDFNTGLGWYALYSQTEGTKNTSLGSQSSYYTTSGSQNTSVGMNSLYKNEDGGNNTSVGMNSLWENTSGSNNTAIGYGAYSTGNWDSSSAIGNNAQPTGDNQVVLGTSAESVIIPGTSDSNSSTSGALQVSGGVGISKDVNVGGDLIVNSNVGIGLDVSAFPNGHWVNLFHNTFNNIIGPNYNTPQIYECGIAMSNHSSANTDPWTMYMGLAKYTDATNARDSIRTDIGSYLDGDANPTPILSVLFNGNVGIGTTSPTALLEVNGNKFMGSFSKYVSENNSYGSYSSTSSSDNISIYTSSGVGCDYISFHSDSRIKKNIIDVPDNIALQQVRDIPCHYYQYIDDIVKGTQQTIGFIAQEVDAVLPMAIQKITKIIPDEYRLLKNISWNTTSDASYNMSSDLSGVSGIKYKFIVENIVGGLNTSLEIDLIGNSDDTFTFDTQYPSVFCYGKEVDDFHMVDKDKIFALHHSSIQKIDEIQLEEKDKTLTLQTKVSDLEAQNTTLLSKVTSLETQMAAVLLRLQALENP